MRKFVELKFFEGIMMIFSFLFCLSLSLEGLISDEMNLKINIIFSSIFLFEISIKLIGINAKGLKIYKIKKKF